MQQPQSEAANDPCQGTHGRALGYSRAVSTVASNASRLDRLIPLLRAEPDNLALHRECVDLAMRGGDFPRALELVDARLTRHPEDPESLFARSNALIGMKHFEQAIEVLRELDARGVAPQAVLQNLMTCHYALQQYATVRVCGERLIASGEASPDVLQLFISSLHFLGEIDEAVKLANQYADVAATHARLAGSCALVYLDVNDMANAAMHAARALQLNPDSIDGLLVDASLAAVELRNEQAFQQYSRVLDLAPRTGRAWLGLGLLATLAQDFTRARELLARATEFLPTHIGSWHARAWAHLFSGDMEGAEGHFRHALELDRNFAESHGAIAAILAMKGDRAGAEHEIELAERLDRNSMTSQYARAILLAQASGPEARDEFIRNAVRMFARQTPARTRAAIQDLLEKRTSP